MLACLGVAGLGLSWYLPACWAGPAVTESYPRACNWVLPRPFQCGGAPYCTTFSRSCAVATLCTELTLEQHLHMYIHNVHTYICCKTLIGMHELHGRMHPN